jgi:uncharacterized RDD family membrane protein YckC
MKRASIFVRFLALSIDIFILFLFYIVVFISALAGYVSGVEVLSFSNLFGFFPVFFYSSSFISLFYFTYLNMNGGMTVGKRAFGIKVVRRDGTELGFLRAFLRSVSYVFSASIWCMGFIMAFFLKGRALHDIIADTVVVEEGL